MLQNIYFDFITILFKQILDRNIPISKSLLSQYKFLLKKYKTGNNYIDPDDLKLFVKEFFNNIIENEEAYKKIPIYNCLLDEIKRYVDMDNLDNAIKKALS